MALVVGIAIYGFQRLQTQQTTVTATPAAFWIRSIPLGITTIVCLIALIRGRNRR